MTEVKDRRAMILATAAEMFASKGIRSTTVREIADAVGVLSGSLYYYFDSKDAIAKDILLTFQNAIRARYAEVLATDEEPAQLLANLVLASLQVAREQPNATAIYQNELQYLRETPQFKEVQAAASEVQHVWMAILERGVADGSFRDDIAPRVFYRMIRDAVWLSGRGHRGDGGYSTKKLADAITSIFLDGFSAQSARAERVAANTA
jgi:TetR/AcrR family transcriptional regulator, cholesterol catabolism regulator